MQLIVDRIEDKYAVCEDENKKMINIDLKFLPSDVKEKDIIEYINGKYSIDINKTKGRKEYIKNLTKDLWK